MTIDSTRDLQALFPNSFNCIGDMKGEYDIKTDPTVPPVQHSRQKVPIEYKEEIEKELAEMVQQRIITKQTEPTPWVSSLTYPKKVNGKLRICLDPKDLNKTVIHENHKAPTLEEIAHILMGATKFSKVDGNKAFFGMHLTEEASLLMMFNTHLRRYRFLHVPFGLKMSQDIFQMRMDDIVAQCPGVLAIHNDVFIYGKNDRDHDTETHYANIERELLAIVYGCEKFHMYLYRRTFIVEMDHKPLEMISLKNLTVAPARLQRMLLHLQQYDLVITYWPGREMHLVDALSHLPSRTNTEIKLDLQVDAISMFAFSQRHLTKIAAETQWDPILSMVHRLTLNSWPDRQGRVSRAARFYWSFQDELSIDGDLLTKGEQVVIPPSCRDNIMADLYGSHGGINKAMDLARTCIYWPGMEADVTDYIKRCLTCIKCSNLPVEMLQPHEVSPGPWVKIGVDFFQDHLGKKHLIVADYFSKFPYVFPVASTHHFKTINHLRELFAAEGVPTIVMSDNRPPFNGEEFRQFSHDFDFIHTTSSPHFHQSNGFIKAMVKKVKNTYKKMDGSPNAQARALLQLHDTPIMADLPSPADSTWSSSPRNSPFKTIQEGQ